MASPLVVVDTEGSKYSIAKPPGVGKYGVCLCTRSLSMFALSRDFQVQAGPLRTLVWDEASRPSPPTCFQSAPQHAKISAPTKGGTLLATEATSESTHTSSEPCAFTFWLPSPRTHFPVTQDGEIWDKKPGVHLRTLGSPSTLTRPPPSVQWHLPILCRRSERFPTTHQQEKYHEIIYQTTNGI